jgi:C-terminal AAA-associated domain
VFRSFLAQLADLRRPGAHPRTTGPHHLQRPDQQRRRQLDTAIDWGRYAELFDYDYDTDSDQITADPAAGLHPGHPPTTVHA